MKKILRQERGVSLISLAAVIVVLGIITTMLLYNVGDKKDVEKLTLLYSDIDNLQDKVSNYYLTYDEIPAISIDGLSGVVETNLKRSDSPIGANDTGEFYVLDLSALDGLTLNYGRDYEKVKNKDSISSNETDLYIINENSHNIFYLKGIKVENHTYYTNYSSGDEEKVEIASETAKLQNIDGIRIFDGYSYESGNKEDGIIISNGTDKYMWMDVESDKYEIIMDNANNCKVNYTEDVAKPDATIKFSEDQNFEDFQNSVNQNDGFYLKQNDEGKVLYFPVEKEKWSMEYETEAIYKDENGDTAYIPKGFQVSEIPGKNTIKEGLVIKSVQSEKEYVWIDVPDSVLEKVTKNKDIEEKLKEYVGDYQKEGYIDTWYNGCGINTSDEYNKMLEKMYKNIKEKGGFWISADEIGNNITCLNAQNGANEIEQVEGKTTSLLFGIQWDLACKFIKENGDGVAETLNILNFATENEEWTLENTTENNSEGVSTQNNSVARSNTDEENGKRISHSCSTRSSSIAYRVTIY